MLEVGLHILILILKIPISINQFPGNIMDV